MLSNIHVLIFAVVWACLSTETSAEALCGNKLSVGEIRVLNSRRCVNIFGTNGQGYMDTYECDGYDDQQLIFCGDGTIRNLAAPQNCATPCGTSSTDGEGRVYSVPCERLPSIPDYQKWDRIVQKSFVDDWGIRQVVYTFRNRKSGKCLDVNGHDGIGRLKTHSCHDRPDQSFYFRSRGKLLVRGRLQNEKSGLCMDNNFDSKFIKLNICHDIPSQYFRFYANGELLNDNERLCVDVSKRDGTGNLRLDDCADQSYQIWSRPKHYCNTDYCPFVNKRSQYCTNTGGYAAKYRQVLNARKCDGGSDQRYKWLIKKLKPASAKWAIIGCNQNGGISHTIHDTVISRSGAEISEAVSKSVAATIEAGVEFHETSLNIPVTSTLANTWSSNRLRTRKSLTFTCKTYDSGKPFRRGCMWRLVVSVKKANNNGLVWKSLIVKCTSSHKEPTCPPFTKCTNSACTKCEDLPRKRSLTSNGGKSFLKKSIQNK